MRVILEQRQRLRVPEAALTASNLCGCARQPGAGPRGQCRRTRKKGLPRRPRASERRGEKNKEARDICALASLLCCAGQCSRCGPLLSLALSLSLFPSNLYFHNPLFLPPSLRLFPTHLPSTPPPPEKGPRRRPSSGGARLGFAPARRRRRRLVGSRAHLVLGSAGAPRA